MHLSHSKINSIRHDSLGFQKYLESDKFSTDKKTTLFNIRANSVNGFNMCRTTRNNILNFLWLCPLEPPWTHITMHHTGRQHIHIDHSEQITFIYCQRVKNNPTNCFCQTKWIKLQHGRAPDIRPGWVISFKKQSTLKLHTAPAGILYEGVHSTCAGGRASPKKLTAGGRAYNREA